MPRDVPQKITEPGLYDLTSAEYHSDICDGPSISSTGLRTIWRDGAAAYWATSIYNPKRAPEERKDAFRIGEAVHLILLEPERIAAEIEVSPFDSWRTNASKEWRAEQEAAGKLVLKQSEWDQISDMRKALREVPEARNALAAGRAEQSLIFKDEKTGVYQKARPDFLPNKNGRLIVDLKTTSDLRRWDLDALKRYRYDMQAALAIHGVQQLCDIEPIGFLFIVQETVKPYTVVLRWFRFKDADAELILQRAALHNRIALDRFHHGMTAGSWPAHDVEPAPPIPPKAALAPPPWLLKEIEEEMANV